MTENLKKSGELKNSTLGKVAFGFSIVSVLSLIAMLVFAYFVMSEGDNLDGENLFRSNSLYLILMLLFSFGLVVGWIGAFILGIIALFKKGYKKTLAIIAVVIGSIFAILILIGSLAG